MSIKESAKILFDQSELSRISKGRVQLNWFHRLLGYKPYYYIEIVIGGVLIRDRYGDNKKWRDETYDIYAEQLARNIVRKDQILRWFGSLFDNNTRGKAGK